VDVAQRLLAQALGGTRADPKAWEWDPASHRYRETKSGRYLSAAQSVQLRNDAAERLRGDIDRATARLINKEIGVDAWQRQMQAGLKELHTVQFAFGRGGRRAMTASDRQELARLIEAQYRYLHTFAVEIAAGTLSSAQIAARARLYASASTASYERGRIGSYAGLSLPQVPGDGSTACRANCKCHLEIRETSSTWRVFWRLAIAEHCDDCRALAYAWNPLVVDKP
jgi:hypothetical protein